MLAQGGTGGGTPEARLQPRHLAGSLGRADHVATITVCMRSQVSLTRSGPTSQAYVLSVSLADVWLEKCGSVCG